MNETNVNSQKQKRVPSKGEKKIRTIILALAISVAALGLMLGILTYCQVI